MNSIYKTSKKEWYTRFALAICGLVIASPGIIGTLSLHALAGLYDTGPLTAIDSVLLQHRAVLLAIVGMSLLISIYWKHLRTPAITAALISNLSFTTLVFLYPTTGMALGVIAGIDIVLSILLITVLILEHSPRKQSTANSPRV